jgi:hypothetical protein
VTVARTTAPATARMMSANLRILMRLLSGLGSPLVRPSPAAGSAAFERDQAGV